MGGLLSTRQVRFHEVRFDPGALATIFARTLRPRLQWGVTLTTAFFSVVLVLNVQFRSLSSPVSRWLLR